MWPKTGLAARAFQRVNPEKRCHYAVPCRHANAYGPWSEAELEAVLHQCGR
jgi:hypothetical protein